MIINKWSKIENSIEPDKRNLYNFLNEDLKSDTKIRKYY
jgi:hypothetical protein